jgi:hypothetical protein
VPAPILRQLYQHGFDVLHARQLPGDIVTTETRDLRLIEPGSIVLPRRQLELTSLASNPSLDEDAFQLLAAFGDARVVSTLLHNPSTDKNRMLQLRETLSTRVEVVPNNDSERSYRARLLEQIELIDTALRSHRGDVGTRRWTQEAQPWSSPRPISPRVPPD